MSFEPETVPAVIVRSPLRVVLSEKDHPPPEPLKVTLFQSEPPSAIVWPVDVASKVTVPLPAVNVPPVLFQLPETVNAPEGAVNVPLERLRLPFTSTAPVEPVN